ncbi:hypothetical protein DCAR_0311754 [Daucus carota subsp. sativus]|uniref:Uncharacterized protein n=1 Tax=Daucus carota subsp. sativus TaxID=79200 RepID=A0A166ANX5_DAUCS|nr:hypothetical protein DCAR_0311754 [Daucus carota subsp. sativus]
MLTMILPNHWFSKRFRNPYSSELNNGDSTAHPKLAVNKAAIETFKGTIKRKPKTITFVTAVKTVDIDVAVKGDPTATFECAVNTDDTKSRNRNGKMNRSKNDSRSY